MPSESKSSRKLAAILFADIVGYTALMQKGEGKAMTILDRYESVLNESVAAHNGKIIKKYGDGSLILFDSTVDAVQCAFDMQMSYREEPPVPLRIGIHVGEVVHKGDDVFGNGVNIASRIESMGVAGAVLLSKNAQEKIKNQESLQTMSLGSFAFKNVEEPIELFALFNEGFPIPKSTNLKGKVNGFKDKTKSSDVLMKLVIGIIIITTGILLYSQFGKSRTATNENETKEIALSSIPKKSIAVLPLKNMSGQDNLAYVCDGMTDAIINRLTLISDLDKVPSMTSVLKYRNPNQSLVEIANELKVANILQGSFQKSGEQIRISLQLIDGADDRQLWSHTYDGEWKPDDIFNIQAKVTEDVAKSLNTQITASESKSIQKMPTTNEEAYSLFLLAEYEKYKSNQEAFSNAIPLYQKAIDLDSTFVEAYIGQAYIWQQGGLVWGIYDEQEAWSNTKMLVNKARKLNPETQFYKSILNGGYFYYDWNFDLLEENYIDYTWKEGDEFYEAYLDYTLKTGRYEKSYNEARKRYSVNPTLGALRAFEAQALMFLGKTDKAIQVLNESDKFHKDELFYLRESIRHYFYLNEFENSQSNLTLFLETFTDRPAIIIWWQIIYGTMNGNDSIVQENLKILNERFEAGSSGSPAWFLSLYYFYINDVDKGFEWLERSYNNHDVEMTWLKEEPLLKKYRKDPRYQSIYQKMGWPEIIKG